VSESPLDYLPHRPPMVLVDEILWVEEGSRTTRCAAAVPADFFLVEEGAIPDVVLIEMMAQASACLKGWIDVHRGLPVKIGYLVGIDTSAFHAPLRPGDRLTVDARMLDEISGYFRFECAVERDGAAVAEATLSFMVP